MFLKQRTITTMCSVLLLAMAVKNVKIATKCLVTVKSG